LEFDLRSLAAKLSALIGQQGSDVGMIRLNLEAIAVAFASIRLQGSHVPLVPVVQGLWPLFYQLLVSYVNEANASIPEKVTKCLKSILRCLVVRGLCFFFLAAAAVVIVVVVVVVRF
jgi:hypothetical protein